MKANFRNIRTQVSNLPLQEMYNASSKLHDTTTVKPALAQSECHIRK